MRQRVVVTGIGAITPAFAGGTAAADAHFAAHGLVASPGAPDAPGAPVAGRAVPAATLQAHVDPGEARRLSHICQLAVTAGRLALADAGLDGSGGVGIVLGSELGDMRSTIDFADGYLEGGPAGISALLFPNTVMNAMAASTAIAVTAREVSVTLNAPTVAGHLAVAHAAAAVAAGRVPAALAGGVDALDDFVGEMLRALGGGAEPRGEGAVFVALEALDSARTRGARVLGEVRGAAVRGLRARPLGVGRGSEGPAIAPALREAALERADLGFVYAGLGGDPERDAWEERVLARALGPGAPAPIALVRSFGQHAGLGPLSVAAAAWSARAAGRAGLVHALARGGTQVALVIGPPPA